MAYTLANLQSDIRSYTEVSDTVLTEGVLETIIKNAENKILRSVPPDRDWETPSVKTVSDTSE